MDELAAIRAKHQAQIEDNIVAIFALALRKPMRRDRTLDPPMTLSECEQRRAVGS